MARFVLRLSIFAMLGLFALAPSGATAQTTDPTGGAGVKSYGSYHGSGIEQISLESSKLIVDVPLISYPQRGGKLRVEFALHWHNPVFTYQNICNPQLHPCLKLFFFDSQPALFSPLEDVPRVTGVFVNNNPQFQNNTIWNADGAGHQAAPVDAAGQGPIYRSIDATGYLFNESTNTITDPNGVRFINQATSSNPNAPVIAEDSNGNEMTVSATNVVDTLGRTIRYPPSSGTNKTSDFTGCTGPLPTQSASLWTPPDQNGGTVTFKFCFASVHIRINAFPSNCSTATLQCDEPNSNVTDLQSIVLPNGTSWEFEYNGGTNPNDATVNAGLLSKITLPTGGTISYTWNTPPENSSVPNYNPQVTSRTVNANDGSGPKPWTYTPSFNGTALTNIVTDPLGNKQVHTLTALTPCGGPGTLYDTQVQFYQGAVAPANLLKTVATTYSFSENPYSPVCSPGTHTAGVVNVVPTSTTTTWPNGQVGKETRSYDPGFNYYPDSQGIADSAVYGKDISETFYDYGTNAPGPVLKQFNNTWLALTTSNYLNANLLTLLSTEQTVNASGVQQALTSNTYDSQSLLSSGVTTQFAAAPDGTFRGNLTGVSHWLNTSNSNLTTTNTYYDTGMQGKMQDPIGNITQYFYSTTYAGGYLTSVQDALNHTTSFVYDFNTGEMLSKTDATTSFVYDFNTGEMLSKTDANKQPTSYSYDSMRRLKQVKYADGGEISYQYTETAVPFTVTTTDVITSALNKTTVESVDGFGREIHSTLTSDPQGAVHIDTKYDGDGRQSTVSNPYHTTTDSTYGIKTYQYDGLGRITSIVQPDSSQVLTSYTGKCTTIADEASKTRTFCSDGLGRMTEVWEDPNTFNYETDYIYDTLGNIMSVAQKGGASASSWRTRTFTYDSLSRLKCAANPEITSSVSTPATCPAADHGTYTPGTMGYTYDANGNVLTKTAPLPNQTGAATVQTTYTYDGLNRLTQKSYNDGTTPTVEFAYDGNSMTGCTINPPTLSPADANPISYRTAMCDGSGATSWAHDSLGRILKEQRVINGAFANNNAFQYSYYQDGEINQVTYPQSGRVITYTPNGAGRPVSAVDIANNINYVTNATYAPQGAIASLTHGASIQAAFSYNPRLQPLQIFYGTNAPPPLTGSTCPATVGNIFHKVYNFDVGASDNGNVVSTANCRDTNRTQNFTYDSLNRIETAATQGTTCSACWGQMFGHISGSTFVPGIDAWGNLHEITVTQGSSTTLSQPVSNNNQFVGMTYDAAGNLTNDGQGNGYTYDAENRLIFFTPFWTYGYDGDGQRVTKCTSNPCVAASGGVIYWRNLARESLAETDWRTGTGIQEYIFFGGKRIARRQASGSVFYNFADQLGSIGVVTSATGAVQQESDYRPFGGEVLVKGPGPLTNYKFTGKERDTESGLDNFGKRYHASTMGRFMTPDPLGIMKQKLRDPQQWNMYSYSRNNPLRFTDPTGMYVADCGSGVKNCDKQIQNLDKSLQNALKSKDPNIVKAAQAYGKLGDANGVNVSLVKVVDAKHPDVTGTTGAQAGTGGFTVDANGKVQQATQVNIKAGMGGSQLEETAVHEGVHVEDRENFVNTITPTTYDRNLNITHAQSERNAYGVENEWLRLGNMPTRNIDDILAHPPYSDNPDINKPLFGGLDGPQ